MFSVQVYRKSSPLRTITENIKCYSWVKIHEKKTDLHITGGIV